MARLSRQVGRYFGGLWRRPDFLRLWASMTITSFGAQITILALPLTAAVLLQATPMQMGILVALETLPFALVSLHAGVLLDRVRKLPIVILSDIGRGVVLLLLLVFTAKVLLLGVAFADLWPSLLASLAYSHGLVFGSHSLVNGVAWSLEVEWQFYLLAPLVFLLKWH